MKTILAAAAVLVLPGAVAAQSQLDRMETVSEKMNDAMMMMMVNEMAANGADPEPLIATMPELTWDAEMREAGACMLDAYQAEIGGDGVDTMLTRMEAFADEVARLSADDLSMEAIDENLDILPEGMTEERSMEITQTCGMLELQMRRMDASGFMEAMMNAAR